MNVTMECEKDGAYVYVADTGHRYDVSDLDRILKQLKLARNWLEQDRTARGKKP